jgi:hypothetical protein
VALKPIPFDFNIAGLDPVQVQDEFAFISDLVLPVELSAPSLVSGSTTLVGSTHVNSDIDFSQAHTGFLLQYEPEALGSINGVALGPELTLPNLSFSNNTTNTIAGTLNPSLKSSFDLSVKGSEWRPCSITSVPLPPPPLVLNSAFP